MPQRPILLISSPYRSTRQTSADSYLISSFDVGYGIGRGLPNVPYATESIQFGRGQFDSGIDNFLKFCWDAISWIRLD